MTPTLTAIAASGQAPVATVCSSVWNRTSHLSSSSQTSPISQYKSMEFCQFPHHVHAFVNVYIQLQTIVILWHLQSACGTGSSMTSKHCQSMNMSVIDVRALSDTLPEHVYARLWSRHFQSLAEHLSPRQGHS